MKRSIKIGLLFAIVLGLEIIQSCHHAPTIPEKQVSFANDIIPIIGGNCQASGCHGQQGDDAFPLISYDDMMKRGLIVPFKPYQSRIYQTVVTQQKGSVMPIPPQAPLTETEIETIFIWIEQGALNN